MAAPIPDGEHAGYLQKTYVTGSLYLYACEHLCQILTEHHIGVGIELCRGGVDYYHVLSDEGIDKCLYMRQSK